MKLTRMKEALRHPVRNLLPDSYQRKVMVAELKEVKIGVAEQVWAWNSLVYSTIATGLGLLFQSEFFLILGGAGLVAMILPTAINIWRNRVRLHRKAFRRIGKDVGSELENGAEKLASHGRWECSQIVHRIKQQHKNFTREVLTGAKVGPEQKRVLRMSANLAEGVIEQCELLESLARRRQNVEQRKTAGWGAQAHKLEQAEIEAKCALQEAEATFEKMYESLHDLLDPFSELPRAASKKLRRSLKEAQDEIEVAKQIAKVMGERGD